LIADVPEGLPPRDQLVRCGSDDRALPSDILAGWRRSPRTAWWARSGLGEGEAARRLRERGPLPRPPTSRSYRSIVVADILLPWAGGAATALVLLAGAARLTGPGDRQREHDAA
jgi:hypothetical protein